MQAHALSCGPRPDGDTHQQRRLTRVFACNQAFFPHWLCTLCQWILRRPAREASPGGVPGTVASRDTVAPGPAGPQSPRRNSSKPTGTARQRSGWRPPPGKVASREARRRCRCPVHRDDIRYNPLLDHRRHMSALPAWGCGVAAATPARCQPGGCGRAAFSTGRPPADRREGPPAAPPLALQASRVGAIGDLPHGRSIAAVPLEAGLLVAHSTKVNVDEG